MELSIINQTKEEKWSNYKDLFLEIIEKTGQLVSLKESYECAVVFVDNETIKAINYEYRGINESTDVISFAMFDDLDLETEENILGDIFINIQAVTSQANTYGHSEKREVGFLFLHGLLHLLGYDHQNQADEVEMFNLQDNILKGIIER